MIQAVGVWRAGLARQTVDKNAKLFPIFHLAQAALPRLSLHRLRQGPPPTAQPPLTTAPSLLSHCKKPYGANRCCPLPFPFLSIVRAVSFGSTIFRPGSAITARAKTTDADSLDRRPPRQKSPALPVLICSFFLRRAVIAVLIHSFQDQESSLSANEHSAKRMSAGTATVVSFE